MKQHIFITISLLFLAGSALGQQFKFQLISDSLELEDFHSFVNSILESERDVSQPDSLSNYRFIYRTSCRNSEVLNFDEILYSTEGKSFSNDSISFETQVDYGAPPLKQITPYYCAEKPSKLTHGLPCTIIKEQIILSNDSLVEESSIDSFETIRIYSKASEYNSYGLVRFSSCTSFENGKYLIIEFFTTTRIGSQTSPGITETLFLEQIE